MKFINNKRGDKILSIYWFAILVIVAGGIFGMVYVFYGSPYDVREIEANALTNRIADCISYSGKINTNLMSSGNFTQKSGEDFLKECHLNFDSTEWTEQQYYTEIDFYKLEDSKPILSLNAGNNKWLLSCTLQEDKEEEKLAKCVRRSFYSLDNANNQYIIRILTAINKGEKNVKK